MITSIHLSNLKSISSSLSEACLGDASKAVLLTRSELLASGMINSSRAPFRIDETIASLLKEYAEKLYRTALTLISQIESEKDALVLKEFFESELQSLCARVLQYSQHEAASSFKPSNPNMLTSYTQAAADQALSRFPSQLILDAESHLKSNNSTVTTNTFHAQHIGNIQFGDGNTAVVNQDFAFGIDAQQLQQTIDKLVEALTSHMDSSEAREMSEMLGHIKAEISQAQPSKSRLKAFLSTAQSLFEVVRSGAGAAKEISLSVSPILEQWERLKEMLEKFFGS